MNHLRILIAVNFTPSSDKAIDFTVRILHKMDCHVRMVYCYSEFIELEEYSLLKLNPALEAKDVREVFAKKLSLEEEKVRTSWNKYVPHGNLILSTMAVKGEVDTMINFEAENWQPNLIVAGSSIEKNTFTELMESTASDIIEKTTLPVLVVPKDTHLRIEQIRNILFLTNFKSEEYNSLHRLIEMLQGKGVTLHCVRYLHDKPDQWDFMRMESLREYISHTYPNQEIVCDTITGDHHLNSLNKYVEEKELGILAVTRFKRRAIFKFLHPDISKKLLHQAHMPILVFNE